MIQTQIILASNSPRRKFLLEQANIQFTINASDIEEIVPDSIPIRQAPEYLAKEKARACDHVVKENEVIIAADTSVFLNDEILNKPHNKEEAMDMLRSMSNTTHEVITGVALLGIEKCDSFSTLSKVELDEMSDEEIHYYIDTYQPFDKAGAYGIQDWIGWCKISRIEGSYSNIFGLPMRDVYQALKQF